MKRKNQKIKTVIVSIMDTGDIEKSFTYKANKLGVKQAEEKFIELIKGIEDFSIPYSEIQKAMENGAFETSWGPKILFHYSI